MNPLKPIKNLVEAVTLPFKAIFVVGLCAVINWMTSPGQWWFQWVALGMGIAVVVAWARAFKTLVLLGLVAFVGWQLYKRYGAAVRDRFDAWVGATHPQADAVLRAFREPARFRTEAGSAG
jgi:hypothetical protein